MNACCCSAPFHTLPRILAREWCHPQWVGLPTPVMITRPSLAATPQGTSPLLGFCLSSTPQLPGNSQLCPSPSIPGNSLVGLVHYKRDCLPLLPLLFSHSQLLSCPFLLSPPPSLQMVMATSASLLSPSLCFSLPLLPS